MAKKNKVYCAIVTTKLSPKQNVEDMKTLLEELGCVVDVFESPATIAERANIRYEAIQNIPKGCTHVFLPDTVDKYDADELKEVFKKVGDATTLLGQRDRNSPEYGCKVVVRADIAKQAAESTLKKGEANIRFCEEVKRLCEVIYHEPLVYTWTLEGVVSRRRKWQS